MSNTSTQKKCFMIAFGENELAGGAERRITSTIHRNLCPPTTNKWICPPNTETTSTNISNVFFVEGDISEIKLSNFYREIIKPIVREEQSTNRERVYFYIKEVEDSEDSFQL